MIFFLKALAKKWAKANVPMEYEFILEKAYAVAHLPTERIAEGMQHITALVDRLANRVDAALFAKLQSYAT